MFFSTAKKICTKSFQKNLKFVVSQCLYNKQITSWLVRVYDFYSRVVEHHKRTSESSSSKTRSFVCDANHEVTYIYEICKNPSTIHQKKTSLGGKLMVRREGLRFIMHYSLTFIHCLSLFFPCSLPIVYSPLFIIYRSLFIVYCPLFDVGCSLTFLIVRVRCSLFIVH